MIDRRGSRVPVARLWCAVFAGYLSFGATFQVLPGWLHQRFGVGAGMTGLAVGVASAATAASRPFAGRAGDSGRARHTVMLGGALIAIGALTQLLAGTFLIVLVGRLVMGAGEAALFSGALPWVLSAAPAGQRGQVAGWFGMANWGGLALGPVVGAASDQLTDAHITWMVIVGLGLLATMLTAATPPQHASAHQRTIRPASWREVLPRGAGTPGAIFGLAAYGYGTISALLVLYLTNTIHDDANLGLAVFATAFLLVRWAGSPAVDRLGATRVATVQLTTEIAGLALLASATTPLTALAGTAIAGAGVSLMFPATVAITLARTAHAGAGNSVGATTSFWDLGILTAGLLGGYLADVAGFRTAFATAAAAALAALILTHRLSSDKHHVPEPTDAAHD